MKVQRVLLSRIDVTADGWDNFIFNPDPPYVDRLAQSFERVGQIYPLLLLKDKDWMFIISGWGRYLAMKKLGVEEVWARVFQKNEISTEQVLWLSLEERSLRPYKDVAKKRVFEKFRDLAGYSIERLANEVAPAIGVEASQDVVRKILGEESL